jgi:hypothetical protein
MPTIKTNDKTQELTIFFRTEINLYIGSNTMIKFLWLLFAATFFNLCLAAVTKSECPSYDYSGRFPPVRDQDGHGYCWAFAATALYEEELCLESRKNKALNYKCAQKLSVLDLSRCDFSLSSDFGEGGSIASGLECVTQKKAIYKNLKTIKVGNEADVIIKEISHKPGICLEKYAPYYNLMSGLSGFADSILGVSDPKSLNDYFVEKRNECHEAESPQKMSELVNDVAGILKDYLPKHDQMGVDFKTAIQKKQLDHYFLRDILITPQCEKTRLNVNKTFDVVEEDFDRQSWTEGTVSNGIHKQKTVVVPAKTEKQKLASLVQSLKKGRSVGGSMCWNKYIKDSHASYYEKIFLAPGTLFDDDACGGHGVVYSGMRWNQTKNQCEVFVRNSWGADAPLDGWVEAGRLMKHTMSTTQLKGK